MPRPLRIGFVAYRGNMQCGGQGIYLWFLARELTRLGHEVDVIVGPPYPDAMPFADNVTEIENEMFWARWFMKDWAEFLPRPNPLRVFRPLHFYELAASRIGFLPEPFAFSLRAFRALADRIRAASKEDATVNALIILDAFAEAVEMSVENSLEELRPFFGAYL